MKSSHSRFYDYVRLREITDCGLKCNNKHKKGLENNMEKKKNKIKYFKDFVGNSSLPYDDSSHGTHICGILCGDGKNSEGKYCGIAPKAHLVVCKILDQKGEGRADIMLQALEFLKRYRKQI